MMMAFTPGHSLSESEEGRGHVRVARRVPATRGLGGSSPETGFIVAGPKASGFQAECLELNVPYGCAYALLSHRKDASSDR